MLPWTLPPLPRRSYRWNNGCRRVSLFSFAPLFRLLGAIFGGAAAMAWWHVWWFYYLWVVYLVVGLNVKHWGLVFCLNVHLVGKNIQNKGLCLGWMFIMWGRTFKPKGRTLKPKGGLIFGFGWILNFLFCIFFLSKIFPSSCNFLLLVVRREWRRTDIVYSLYFIAFNKKAKAFKVPKTWEPMDLCRFKACLDLSPFR